jgi:hypothetical protein
MGGEGKTGRRGDIRAPKDRYDTLCPFSKLHSPEKNLRFAVVPSRTLIRLRKFSGSRRIWVGNKQDFSGSILSKYMRVIFSTCLTAHANHRITRTPSTDGTMRAGLRAVVAVRRESARATPTFRKKLQLRRVQRSRLNGRDARLSDLEAELEQLATDARRSPQRICRAHLPDQRAQIRGDLRSASKGAGFLTPVLVETALHILGAVVWVGGMFAIYVCLCPALGTLEPPQRLRLMRVTFQKFFPWVWLAILLLLGSGYWMFFTTFGGFAGAGLYIHLMEMVGWLMIALFVWLFHGPWPAAWTPVVIPGGKA